MNNREVVLKTEKKVNTQKSINGENSEELMIKSEITILEDELKELKSIKELKEGIQAADVLIRQKVLSHIFNNINDIAKITGGESFINTIVGDNNPLHNISELTLAETQKQKEELEAKLLEKQNNDQSLEEIKSEITQKEQKLLDLKNQLLNIKRISDQPEESNKNIDWNEIFIDIQKEINYLQNLSEEKLEKLKEENINLVEKLKHYEPIQAKEKELLELKSEYVSKENNHYE